MTAHLAYLPGMKARCARITANAKAEHEAEALALAVTRFKRMVDDPRGYTDAQMGTACGWFMRLSNVQRDDDGNVYYQRADQLLFAIERRRQVAVNRAKCRAAVARIDETSARIAMRHLRRWPEIVIGGACFVGFWWIVFSGVLA